MPTSMHVAILALAERRQGSEAYVVASVRAAWEKRLAAIVVHSCSWYVLIYNKYLSKYIKAVCLREGFDQGS